MYSIAATRRGNAAEAIATVTKYRTIAVAAIVKVTSVPDKVSISLSFGLCFLGFVFI